MAGPSGSTAALSPAPRPNYVRRETDQILSYYQSDLAGRPYATAADMDSQRLSTTTHSRKGSTASSSSDYSSEYSSESLAGLEPPPASTSQTTTPVRADFALPSEEPEHPPAHGGAARHSRRPSVPSEGGADRRRVAIVEMDAAAQRSVSRKRSKGLSDAKSSSSSSMSGSTLFSRRGVNIGGLALVAPPDAARKAYTDLTPPSTAPADRASHPPPSSSSHYHAHARSASEAVDAGGRARRLHHKSSRDVGIVGLSSASTASDSLSPASPTSDDYHSYVHTEGLGVPVFQTPAKSRSPSPCGGTPDLSDTSSASAHHRSLEQRLLSTPIFGMEDGIVTPGIGEWKDIQQPVVGPVIVGLPPEMMQRTQPRRPASAAPPQHSHSQPSSSVQSPTSRSPNYQSSHSSSPASSPYLHYQPGVHATAGPLPPPPRSIFDNTAAAPPRPPRFHTPVPTNNRPVPANTKREIEAIKEKLQLPQSVSAVLAARTPPEANRRLGHNPSPSRSDTRDSEESTYSQDNETSVKLVPASSVHRREGAFPPSTIMTSPPGRVGEEQSTSSHMVSSPVVAIEPEREEDADEDTPARERKDSERRSGIELLRKSSWVSLSEEATELLSSPNGKSAALPKPPPISRSASSVSGGSSSSSSSGSSRLPVPPPKNGRSGSDDERQQNSLAPSSFRATLTNLKRFSSLPRTPSRSSRSSKRSTSPEARRSLSPSIEPIHVELPPRRRMTPRPTKISSWPQAMVTRDVTMLRSARERAKMYAEKINELAEYDCGLRDWMASQRPGSHPRTQSQRTALQPNQLALPAELGGMAHTNRHVSHGSLASQATFPIRADAYTATDLSTRSIDIIPSSSPPTTLPYPSLAQANLSRAQMRSSTLLSSPTKSPLTLLPGAKGSGTGFFASLGRKTSVRREKGLSGLSSPQSPTKLLTKRPPPMAASRSNPSNSTSPRDAPLPTAPAIPGGPRAAPGRIQRSKTYSVSASPPQPSPPENPHPPIQSPTSPQSIQRQSAIPRRPSLFARARPGHSSVGSPAPNVMDPAFQRQVDKLAAILPHADRGILAGYLRRAGEDILAIGQYLEDEKNGTLQRE
ncbi:uncharacterized protein TRAVEDRAFT_70084 [Trametes versicolor FP-101664 SS1]|uniref:uncharacterized protein n=1 Tax=Trametes versicolor (strain FP-101664) TaxID=717944 RepID=UPI0004622465|nr:uncharacterized protein TRAVEDRAFT_70084 [Trametes versicolor FP-101664 SS1]EIW61825.1 hypothetical protein TRAVEDRAFT_70084 [Trametes versicolor FP-101664 SS1]